VKLTTIRNKDMKHKHLFKNIGGGCAMPVSNNYNPKSCCDDDYKCDCGEKFTVYSSMTGHRFLPESFLSKNISEIKKAEQEAITDAFLENLDNKN
jgi:hypothetical protein